MGQPGPSRGGSPERERTRGTETSKYPVEEKATAIPLVAASERGTAQTDGACSVGVVGPRRGSTRLSLSGLEWPARDGESPVGIRLRPLAVSRVPRDTRNPAGSWGDHPPRLNTPL
jgi:hypothetical protein